MARPPKEVRRGSNRVSTRRGGGGSGTSSGDGGSRERQGGGRRTARSTAKSNPRLAASGSSSSGGGGGAGVAEGAEVDQEEMGHDTSATKAPLSRKLRRTSSVMEDAFSAGENVAANGGAKEAGGDRCRQRRVWSSVARVAAAAAAGGAKEEGGDRRRQQPNRTRVRSLVARITVQAGGLRGSWGIILYAEQDGMHTRTGAETRQKDWKTPHPVVQAVIL